MSAGSGERDRWAGRRCLVTGATGLVGSWLTRRLVDLGAMVVVLVRDADPQSELFRSGTISRTSVVNGQLEDIANVDRAINQHDVDTVFHLGAQTIVGAAHRSPLPTMETNVLGTANVLEICRLHPDLVTSVVVASSDKAYGAAPLPYLESTPLEGRHPYEVSKSCTDLIAQCYGHTYGVPVGVARCGNIYGGGDLNWSRIVPGTIRSLLMGERPVIRSDGSFLRDYLYVEDVVDLYLTLSVAVRQRTAPRIAYNFSDQTPLSVMELYDRINLAVGTSVEADVRNTAVGEIKDQYLNADAAKDELGWSVRHGLDDGLRRTVAWYRALLAAQPP